MKDSNTKEAGERETSHLATLALFAYNQERFIAEAVRGALAQTYSPLEIILSDDCSTDRTAEVARESGAEVVRPPENTGSKAGAQTFALAGVETDLVMAVDADTTLAPDAIERLLPALEDPTVAAACGFVLPRRVRTIWERGRYVEYMLAFGFFKRIQDTYGKPLISSGLMFHDQHSGHIGRCG